MIDSMTAGFTLGQLTLPREVRVAAVCRQRKQIELAASAKTMQGDELTLVGRVGHVAQVASERVRDFCYRRVPTAAYDWLPPACASLRWSGNQVIR